MRLRELFFRSLKPVETEELPDLFIYRPLAFLFALALRPTPVTPNMVTLVAMAVGVASGYFFAHGTNRGALLGAIFLMIANVLDCTDGQLARLRGTSSRLGKTLDGLADMVVYVSIFAGVAIAMGHSSGAMTWWWVYAVLAGVSVIIHIIFFDFFKNELIFYAIPAYHEKVEPIARLRAERERLGRSAFDRIHRLLLTLYIAFYGWERALTGLALPRGYRGYLEWYEGESGVPKEVKERFRANYRRHNRALVRGWTLIGSTGHITVFLLAGLCNRLDLVFWVIAVPFNIWTLLLAVVQRLTLTRQLRDAYRQAPGSAPPS
ncbi:MAG: CDP-alcohol phosphatidyltransferase family protein [candidate division KSB1 bacterium]|nr:CDP-alcohol phosphatidyltransferase family protein [candidate division KSB1 bacterium]